ncbi:MAG: septum formation initiator family protein [Patescibacteria group bacterium]
MLKSLCVKIVAVFLFFIIAWISFSLYKLYFVANSINKELDLLNAKILKLKDTNKDIVDTMEYMNTADYREKEAKEKFNLQKPGEKVIIINRKSSSASQEMAGNDDVAGEQKYFWQKWLDYFWGK